MADQSVSLGAQNLITLSPSPDNSPLDCALLNKAIELTIKETSTSIVLSNYTKIWVRFVFDGQVIKGGEGFIFNQSDFLWQVSNPY